MPDTNPFIQVVQQAYEQRWCVKMYCTTCGATEYRSALQEVGGELGGPLCDALSEVGTAELVAIPNWVDALVLAMMSLPLPDQMVSVLEAWLGQQHLSVRFVDVVLFKVVRRLPDSYRIKDEWINKGKTLAIETRDFSLTETLLLLLRDKVTECVEILDIAQSHAILSSQMRRVIRNVCGLKEPAT